MRRVQVVSSNLKSVGYAKTKRVMEIGFKSGRVYQYQGVSPERHQGLMDAASHGKYHWKHVRTALPYKRVK